MQGYSAIWVYRSISYERISTKDGSFVCMQRGWLLPLLKMAATCSTVPDVMAVNEIIVQASESYGHPLTSVSLYVSPALFRLL